MTDPRMGDALWSALARLPAGTGIVFRHYGHPARRALYDRVRTIARARRLVLVLAGPPALAIAWRADGAHGRSPHRRVARPLLRTAPVHGMRERTAAIRTGADAIFVSPAFATRSHPGAAPLGVVRFGLLARGAGTRIIALGGMNPSRARRLKALGADGWAGIDAF
ncbi:thiamine phosphate synthase [Sphingomonas sp. KC8]|uniref:thiamine phosphate synthase n=1 Tax=Sphingomonas sp. KC8 TaxID=1030157 RepID=UPI001E4502BC|nr:thiamine phosphate synthase [Sphingomonas sp. KC8]